MNIVVINGSLRKKNTYGLLKKIEELFVGHNIEFLNIGDYDIKPCVGCEGCMRKGHCHINDDVSIIKEKILEADGIVIGSPIHLRQISGILKVLFDRACSWYHRSPIVGVPLLFVTTTQVTGTKNAVKYMQDLMVQWGVIYTGTISRTVFNSDEEVSNKEVEKFEYYLKPENKIKYKPSFKEVFEFNTQKVLAEEILPLDKEYWEEKEYLNRPYFYRCRISVFKRVLGKIYYKFLSNIISKNKKV